MIDREEWEEVVSYAQRSIEGADEPFVREGWQAILDADEEITRLNNLIINLKAEIERLD